MGEMRMDDLIKKAGFHDYLIWRHEAEFKKLQALILEKEQEKFLDKMVDFAIKLNQKEKQA